jgi:hypothetical protein
VIVSQFIEGVADDQGTVGQLGRFLLVERQRESLQDSLSAYQPGQGDGDVAAARTVQRRVS